MKEREGKKGKTSVEQESSGQEEHGEEGLQFTDDLTREPVSQEGEGNSLLSSGKYLVVPIFVLIHFIGLFFLLFFLMSGFTFVPQTTVLVFPVMHPSPRPARILRIASLQYLRVLLPALALGVPWPQTPSPRSTADVSESKCTLLPHMEEKQNVSRVKCFSGISGIGKANACPTSHRALAVTNIL